MDPNDESSPKMEIIPSGTSPYQTITFTDSPSFVNPSNEEFVSLENINKYISQIRIWHTGEWINKPGSPGVYQILDPDDKTTVKMEVITSDTSPYKTVIIF